jgi:hypothetical protein
MELAAEARDLLHCNLETDRKKNDNKALHGMWMIWNNVNRVMYCI